MIHRLLSHGKPNSTIQDKRFSIELQCCLLLCALFVCPGVFFNVNFLWTKSNYKKQVTNKSRNTMWKTKTRCRLVGCLFVCFPSSRFSMFYVLHFKHVRIQYVWQWTPWPQGNPNVFLHRLEGQNQELLNTTSCHVFSSLVELISHEYLITIALPVYLRSIWNYKSTRLVILWFIVLYTIVPSIISHSLSIYIIIYIHICISQYIIIKSSLNHNDHIHHFSYFSFPQQHKHCIAAAGHRAVAAPLRQAAPERDVLGPMASCQLQPLAVPTVPGTGIRIQGRVGGRGLFTKNDEKIFQDRAEKVQVYLGL